MRCDETSFIASRSSLAILRLSLPVRSEWDWHRGLASPTEPELFHNQPADRALRYMQHINSVSQKHGEVTYKLSHAKAT